MDDAQVQHFRRLLQPLLPAKAIIRLIELSDCTGILHIDYAAPLGKLLSRRSASFNLIFPQRTLTRYFRSDDLDRAFADNALKKFMRRNLQYFEWEHNNLPGKEPEKSSVISEDLLFPSLKG